MFLLVDREAWSATNPHTQHLSAILCFEHLLIDKEIDGGKTIADLSDLKGLPLYIDFGITVLRARRPNQSCGYLISGMHGPGTFEFEAHMNNIDVP